jgi:hypothetical protein
LTKGKPEKWPVVFLAHGWESQPEQFAIDVTAFLARYATNQYKSLLPGGEPFADKDRTFIPGSTSQEVAQALLKKRRQR